MWPKKAAKWCSFFFQFLTTEYNLLQKKFAAMWEIFYKIFFSTWDKVLRDRARLDFNPKIGKHVRKFPSRIYTLILNDIKSILNTCTLKVKPLMFIILNTPVHSLNHWCHRRFLLTQPIEFSRNTQSLQHWHFCTIFNIYQLEMFEISMSYNGNWHLCVL